MSKSTDKRVAKMSAKKRKRAERYKRKFKALLDKLSTTTKRNVGGGG